MIGARENFWLHVHSKSQELDSLFRLFCVAAEIKAAVNLAVILFLFSFPSWWMVNAA